MCFAWVLGLWGCGLTEVVQAGDAWTVIRPADRDPARWGAARCNDGSATSVVWRPSPSGSHTWVVRVNGGFYCDDGAVPCATRAPEMTTALGPAGKPIPDGGRWGGGEAGLFSRDPAINPRFWDANQAFLDYCTSDVWLGESTERRPTTGSPDGWYFSGRHAFRAGFESLEAVGLDPADPKAKLLVVGQSSGGLGLVANLPFLEQRFPAMVADHRVKAVVDGGWIAPVPIDDRVRLNRWGALHPACEADRRAAGEDPAACLFGPVWYPYWAASGVDLLVAQSGQDVTQVKHLQVEGALGRGELAERTRHTLEGVPRVVSANYPYHLVSFDPRLPETPLGEAFLQGVDALWSGGEARRVFLRYDEAP